MSNSVFLGVLLPGDVIKFHFIFKSPNAGIFSEQWEFQTHPVVCGGAKLLVTLRGVALKQDQYEEHRTELEVRLLSHVTVETENLYSATSRKSPASERSDTDHLQTTPYLPLTP